MSSASKTTLYASGLNTAAELRNVILHPIQCQPLVEDAAVRVAVRFDVSAPKESIHPEAILDLHVNHAALGELYQGMPIVRLSITLHVTAAVNLDHDWQLR